MCKIIILCLISWFLFVLLQPGLSWDILEPEEFEMTDAWLTSEPQPGVDYHVLRVCQDEDMTVDCTQCIYKAKSDGAVWIPTNNRCIYRIQNDTTYSLFFQIKASSISGLQSEWTIPRIVIVDRTVENLKTESSSISLIIYNTSDSDNNTSDSDSSAQPYVIVSTEEGIHEENDVDGIPDDVDYRPGSNLEQTITIDGCDSGVENSLFEDGFTMSDLIAGCVGGAKNHGKFVSCVDHLTNNWEKEKLIEGKEQESIQSCAEHANIP